MELAAENIVVTASKFNPSILNQIWLSKKGFVREGDFLDACIFTPVLVQVQSRQFAIFAIEDRLQFSFQPHSENKPEIVEKIFGGIISELPETPYTALGLNFVWNFTPRLSIEEAGRALFPNPLSPLYQAFDAEGARFGGYFSKDVLGFRLKLAALPVLIQEGPQDGGMRAKDVFQFQFNFHADVKSHADVGPLLKNWAAANKMALEMMQMVERSA